MAPENPQSDEAIVTRVLAGETELYESLVRRYNERLFRAIRSILSNDAESEDVLQEAWVRAYEHLGQFEGRAKFATWVTRIAAYEALARARRQERFTALEEPSGEIMPAAENQQQSNSNPEQQAIRGELAHLLESALDRLPISYRSVFVLRAVEQMSTAEAAGCLNISEESVKTRLHRSRAMLRRDLEDRIGPAVVTAYSFQGGRCDRVTAAVMDRIAAVHPAWFTTSS